MSSRNPSRTLTILIIVFLMIATYGCKSSSQSDQDATVEALAYSISLTATAGALDELSPEDSLKTAEAEATIESAQEAATQTAHAALSAEAVAETASAIAPILDQLTSLGIDPNQGRVAWIHPPAALETDGYMQTDFINRYMNTTVKDFALSADVTWNTQYGTSGCGFILRSDGKEEESNQYLLILSRFGDGRAVFMTIANGELVDGKDMYAAGLDPNFNEPNDATNNLTVLGQGTEFSVFTNGTLVGEVTVGNPPTPPPIPTPPPTPEDPALMDRYNRQLERHEEEVEQIQANYRARVAAYQKYNTNFERGFVALAVFSESGKTSCHFENAWLWIAD